MNLDRLNGPCRRRFGCAATLISPPDPTGWFNRQGKARCGHCGLTFAVSPDQEPPPPSMSPPIAYQDSPPLVTPQAILDPPPLVPVEPLPPAGAVWFVLLRCPHCQSTDTVVAKRKGTVRYHKCRGCQASFKSVERSP
jgi:hypothetical protein